MVPQGSAYVTASEKPKLSTRKTFWEVRIWGFKLLKPVKGGRIETFLDGNTLSTHPLYQLAMWRLGVWITHGRIRAATREWTSLRCWFSGVSSNQFIETMWMMEYICVGRCKIKFWYFQFFPSWGNLLRVTNGMKIEAPLMMASTAVTKGKDWKLESILKVLARKWNF